MHHLGAGSAPSAIAVAVRQTPLTATESPSASSPASARAHAERDAVVGRVDDGVTVPRSCDEPGEHASPLPQPRARSARRPPIRSTSSASARVASAIRSTPSPSSGSRALEPPSDDRREEQPQLVELARVEERARELRPALEQDRGDVGGAELVERRAHARGLVLPGRDDHLGAGGLERVGLQPRGGAADDDRQRQLGRAAHELRVERQAALGVEHDAARLARDAAGCAR